MTETKKRSLSFTLPKRVATNGAGDQMAVETPRGGSSSNSSSTTANGEKYNYGLIALRENCEIVRIDINGASDLRGCSQEDRVLISNFVNTSARYLVPDYEKCRYIITTNQQTRQGHTLLEYLIIIQLPPDTVFEIQSLALLQHINPLRCGTRDSIKQYYDRGFDKQCVLMAVSASANLLGFTDNVLIHQHYSISSMLATSDDDDSSSRQNYDETSINRKRAKKNEVKHEKICDNT